MVKDLYEKIVQLAKRRGFFWPAYEIYGGVRGLIALGPLGVLLKNNIIEKWRKIFIIPNQDFIVEIETPILTPEKIFIASGHVEHFTDYIVECLRCGRKYRADHLLEEVLGMEGLEKYSERELTEIVRKNNVKCPECGGELSEVRKFNLLFKTTIGPYSENIGYARPETAQGMFTEFHRVHLIEGRKLPLGIAQIGKVFRNEISPRQGLIRLREFSLMEIELFYDPLNPSCKKLSEVENEELNIITAEMIRKGEKNPITITVREALAKKIILNEWNAYFMALGKKFVEALGVPSEKQVFVEKLPEERAHYALQTFDQMVKVSRWGWIEVAGHADRTNYDLSRHRKYSGVDIKAFRRLKKPKLVEEVSIRPKIESIKREFPGKFKEILKRFSKIDEEELYKTLKNNGFIVLNLDQESLSLPKEYFEIKVKQKRVEEESFIPYVAEPSYGIERLIYVTIENAYREENGRVFLKFSHDIAPVKVAVFPIVETNKEIVEISKSIYNMLKDNGFIVMYQQEGTIGKRYVYADEIGVPYAITVDQQTLQDNTVTIRDIETRKQVRVSVKELLKFLDNKLRA